MSEIQFQLSLHNKSSEGTVIPDLQDTDGIYNWVVSSWEVIYTIFYTCMYV